MSDSAQVDAIIAAMLDEGEANRELRRSDPATWHAKVVAELPTNNCSLCRAEFKGWGHNPAPVLNEGKACDTCNAVIVVPARIRCAGGAS